MKPRISKVPEYMRFSVGGAKWKCVGNISGVCFSMFGNSRKQAYRKFESAYYEYTLSMDLSLEEYIKITEDIGFS